MRLADYVVSYSLQIDSRCLRHLGDYDPHGGDGGVAGRPQAAHAGAVYSESVLARDARRLVSLWTLMDGGGEAAEPALAAHLTQLRQAVISLSDAHSAKRIALRLASLAKNESDARAMLLVNRRLPAESAPGWSYLSGLFAADGALWRDPARFADFTDETLVQQIARSYRKAYRRAQTVSGAALGERNHDGYARWVQRSAHQMELLRSGLSEKGKAQAWYLEKLADTLRMRIGLRRLARQQMRLALTAEVLGIAERHVAEQIVKMDKRVARLAEGSFTTRPKKMQRLLGQSVSRLGLKDVRLLRPEEVRAYATREAG